MKNNRFSREEDNANRPFRSKLKITLEKNTGVEMNDDIRTGNGVVNIGFDDKTKVQIDLGSQ